MFILAVGLSSSSGRAIACGRCPDQLDLRATARRAGLVVVARRIGDELPERPGAERWEGYAPFEVQRVIKGWPVGNRIDVIVRAGMCDEGIDVERGQSALLFLERSGDHYITVWGECAVRSLPIVNGKVVLSDLDLPAQVLGEQLGLLEAPPLEKRPSTWVQVSVCGLLLMAGLAVGFWVGRRRD